MALDYDTGVGYENNSSGTYHNLVKKTWDTLLHEQVQNKLFWRDMIGADKGGEGSIDTQVSNFPVVEKTQLGKEAGDQITMGLVTNLGGDEYTAATGYDIGKSSTDQLVDNEGSLTFYYLLVKIGHHREGVLNKGKLTQKRSPFQLMQTATDLLSTQLAKYKDDGLFYTFYAGYSPSAIRELNLTTVTHPNMAYGKNKAALTDVDTADVVDTDLLERLGVLVKVQNINPVMIDGKKCHGLIVHPYGMKTLRADSAWQDSNRQALPRGEGNPIFTRADGRYANIYVMEDNRVSVARVFGSVTASSHAIGALAAATTTITSTDVRMNILFGANAIARAVGVNEYMADRKEDDYGNLKGIAGGYVYGDRRADWLDDAASGTTKNQSSFIVYTSSPNPNSNISSIW